MKRFTSAHLASIIYALLLLGAGIFMLLPTKCLAQENYAQRFCKSRSAVFEMGSMECGNWFCMKVASKDITWKTLYKDPTLREMVMRVNRTNRDIYPGMEIIVVEGILDQVPTFYQSCLTKINPIVGPSPKAIAGHKTIIFDMREMAWSAYNELGVVLEWGMATGGRRYCKDIDRACRTPVGMFKVLTKKGKYYRSQLYPVNCEGKDCTQMPWYVRFRSDGPGFHASKWIRGIHESHGCIRLTMEDAKWLNKFADLDTVIEVRPYR